MHFDGSDVQYVVALDKRTGKTVWQTKRSVDFKDLEPDGKVKADGDFRKAFSTPHDRHGGQRAGVRQPRIEGGLRLRSADREGAVADRGADQLLVEQPAGGGARPGLSTRSGWNTGQVLAVKPDGRGDVTATHVAWRSTRGAPKKPSMLLLGDLLMMINDTGIITCLDARTGAEVWTARLTDSYSASPIAADGRVYFFSEDGKATVIEAGRTFKMLAENIARRGVHGVAGGRRQGALPADAVASLSDRGAIAGAWDRAIGIAQRAL